MQAKIWNYQAWINETDDLSIFKKYDIILRNSGFTIIDVLQYKFHPFGYSALWLLSESHFAVHTFPEENKTYIELSSCNKEMLERFKKYSEFTAS